MRAVEGWVGPYLFTILIVRESFFKKVWAVTCSLVGFYLATYGLWPCLDFVLINRLFAWIENILSVWRQGLSKGPHSIFNKASSSGDHTEGEFKPYARSFKHPHPSSTDADLESVSKLELQPLMTWTSWTSFGSSIIVNPHLYHSVESRPSLRREDLEYLWQNIQD